MGGDLLYQSIQGLFNGWIYAVLRMNVGTILFYEFLYFFRGHMTFVFEDVTDVPLMKFGLSFR